VPNTEVPICGDPDHAHTGPCELYAHMPADPERLEYIVSWDMLTTQVGQLASRVRQLHGLQGAVVGLHPLPGAEAVTLAVSAATALPVVSHVGTGVVLLGLVARRCAMAQRWIDVVGEGLPGVLWAFRAHDAPTELATPAMPGMGDPITFPVVGVEAPAATWLVMPWEAPPMTLMVEQA
jgi:hypothetical protein